MSKSISFDGFGEYTPGEVTFIIESLAAMQTSEEVQEGFRNFTNGQKVLPGQVIQLIQLKFADKIRRQTEIYLNNIQGNPLAHLRVRTRHCL